MLTHFFYMIILGSQEYCEGIFGPNTCTSYDGLDEMLVIKEFKLLFLQFYSLQIFPEPKGTTSNCSFFTANSAKPKYTPFIMI